MTAAARPSALVAGASDPQRVGNIGAAIARRLAPDHRVLITDLRDPSSTARDIGHDVLGIAADATDPKACAEMVARAETLGPLRVVVHAVGITFPAQPVEKLPLAEWDLVLRTNLTSAFSLAQAAIPALRRAGGGNIVLISSRAGRAPFASRGVTPVATKAHYAVSKAGIISLTRSLALELAADGIRVNCVAPGPVKTRVIPQTAHASAAASVPLGRMAEPDEVASVVRFLCSTEASYMTGAIVDVNGAQVLY